MALNKNDINNIATISKIEIHEEQIDDFSKQLNELFEIITKIKVTEINNTEPLISPISIMGSCEEYLREDVNPKTCSQEFMETIALNSPEFDNNLFIVPKIIEQL